jgi:hypothetical protein
VPLTLDEALANGAAKLTETGEVNSLEIENGGDEPIFVQSGDIVKGGQQDRALVASLLVPPHSGPTRIAVYCVEQGRWSGRAGENPKAFSSAAMALPSRAAKIAIKTPAVPASPGSGTGSKQLEVWKNVKSVQESLSSKIGVPVASPQSQTSLQLALENEALAKALAEYVNALQPLGEKDSDIVGYAFAVNGKLSTADIYPSNGLFRKMWGKLVKSAAAEAIAARTTSKFERAPSTNAVNLFLKNAEDGTKADQEVARGIKVETHDSSGALYSVTSPTIASSPGLPFIHRSYLAK